MLSRDNASYFYGLSTMPYNIITLISWSCRINHVSERSRARIWSGVPSVGLLGIGTSIRCMCVLCTCARVHKHTQNRMLIHQNESLILIKWAIFLPREINLTRSKSAQTLARAHTHSHMCRPCQAAQRIAMKDAMRCDEKKSFCNYKVKKENEFIRNIFKIGSSANE